MIKHQHVTVIIPALNEEKAIPEVLRNIPVCIDQTIVIDNDSTDKTAEAAVRFGAKVIREPRKGYGRACLTGIDAAGATDIFAFLDGGRRDYPDDLVELLELVANGDCQLAIGCRRDESNESRGRLAHQKLGTQLACWCINVIYGVRFSDLGPMRCIAANHLKQLGMVDENFGWTTEMQLKAHLKGMNIIEIPVRSRARIGTSKISGTVRGTMFAGCKIFYWIFRLALTKRPATH